MLMQGTQGWAGLPCLWPQWAGNLELVKLLLDKGADPNAMTMHGTTALMTAVTWNTPTS